MAGTTTTFASNSNNLYGKGTLAMYFLLRVNRTPALLNIIGLTTAIIIGMTAIGDADAASHGGAHSRGHARGAFGGPIYIPAPLTSPIFNPSYRYVVPQAPEVPVSPASPGSVFGSD
jgi:hypothetical protein